MTNGPSSEVKLLNSIRISTSLFAIIGSFLLAAGFINADMWYLGVISPAALAVWLLGLHYGWNWALTLPFILQCGFIGAGFLLGVWGTWLIGGLIFLLGAWDLSMLWMRFRSIEQKYRPSILIQKHYMRLISVLFLGAVLAAIPLVTELNLGFGWLAGIALVMMVGLSLGIRRVLRSTD